MSITSGGHVAIDRLDIHGSAGSTTMTNQVSLMLVKAVQCRVDLLRTSEEEQTSRFRDPLTGDLVGIQGFMDPSRYFLGAKVHSFRHFGGPCMCCNGRTCAEAWAVATFHSFQKMSAL